MTKQTLGIVSSYNESCGNATYTKALADGLAQHFDVTVIPLNVELLRKSSLRQGREHIKEVVEKVKTFDCINIQFEAALFGDDFKTIEKRFFTVADAAKKLVLTMHQLNSKEKYPSLLSLANCIVKKKIRDYASSFRMIRSYNNRVPLYDNIIRYCQKRNIPIVVHTPRDRKLIAIKHSYNNVFDHPLCFYDPKNAVALGKKYSRDDFCNKFGLDPNKTYIGLFGFISGYKGYQTAIKSLQVLPDKYELLIFGSQHPHTIRLHEQVNMDIEKILDLTMELNLAHRVRFFSSIKNDDEFLMALYNCDFNVLPYLEVYQGGSAIAALSLETHSQAIFSQNLAFIELAKYAPGAFKMISIGNYLELAQAIQSYRKSDYNDQLTDYHNNYNINTSAALYKSLLECPT